MRWSTASATLVFGAALAASTASAQVCHHGTMGETVTRWETTFAGPVSFVGPLPADVEVERVDGGVVVTSQAGVVGIAPRAGHIGPLVLVTRQTGPRSSMVLHPPLVRGPQRVVLGTDDQQLLAFTPEPGGPLESFVGYHASRSIDERGRRYLDAACGSAPSDRGARIYVDASSHDDLRGRTVRGSDRRGAVAVITAALLVLGLVLGAIAYRRLSGRAQVEYADAMIDRRFKDLEDRFPPPARTVDRTKTS